MGVADRSWINTPYQFGQRLISVVAKAGASAKNKVRKPEAPAPVAAAKPVAPSADPGLEARRVESITVANVKWEAGGAADQSVVTLDLAWDNSWRAKWEEPAEKNVTGKPLKLESWDAAWVFIKFRKPGDRDEVHATLSTDAAQYVKPSGAALDVGLSDDGGKGLGVFVYRAAVGSGANAFTGLKLRWLHGMDKVTDPAQVNINAYAIPMVYIPKGPFKSKSPWGYPLTLIDTADPTKPGGYPKVGPGMTPETDSWPNGVMAYYCMKYPISQGQYAGFLNSVASDLKATTYNAQRYGAMAMENVRRFSPSLYNINGYTITTNASGAYVADVPDRTCNFLSLFDIQSYMGWSGLRPLTSLEYEKACRGPREVAREEDAWTPADCAPAAELPKPASERLSPIGLKPSFWGIRGLSLSGCVQEWPASVCQTEIPTPDQKRGACVGYNGTHGTGSPEVSEDWVWTFFGEWYYGGIWRCKGYGSVGNWILISELDRMPQFWSAIDGSRTGRYGALAGRTAPVAAAANAMLQIDALPKLTGIDIGVFYLSGRLNNTSDNPLNVELSAPVSDVCFLDGAASRALSVASKAVKPFKIAMALTLQSAMNGAVRGGTLLPIRLQGKDGIVLEESLVPLQMTVSSPVISSIKGGEVALHITNTTDRALTLAVRLAPVGVTLTETNKSVTVAAGAEARAVFPVPIQGFASTGPCKIPYSIVVGTGAPQAGEAVVDLKTESRWWISKRVKGAPKSGAFDEGPDSGDDMVSALAGLSDLVSYDGSIFKADKPPKDWTPATYGANIAFGEAGKLPSHGSAMLAATRVEASADREAVLTVQHATKARFDVTVWFNDAMVFKMGGSNKNETKPFTLRKTGNTMMVECRSAETGAVTPGALSLQFNGAKDGKPITGLLFDIEKR
jgi:formylglycine-generating enzyme required for sulfatase activity